MAWILAAGAFLIVGLPALTAAQQLPSDTLTLIGRDGQTVSASFVPEEVTIGLDRSGRRATIPIQIEGAGLDGAVKQLEHWIALRTKVSAQAKSAKGQAVLGWLLSEASVLESFSLRFTLFLDDGTPVRATMNTVWKEFSPAEEQLRGNPRH